MTGGHDDQARTAADWLAAFADRCDLPAPDDTTIATLLEIAGIAAHSSERIAAPITCWLIGQAGLDPADALTIAREI